MQPDTPTDTIFDGRVIVPLHRQHAIRSEAGLAVYLKAPGQALSTSIGFIIK